MSTGGTGTGGSGSASTGGTGPAGTGGSSTASGGTGPAGTGGSSTASGGSSTASGGTGPAGAGTAGAGGSSGAGTGGSSAASGGSSSTASGGSSSAGTGGTGPAGAGTAGAGGSSGAGTGGAGAGGTGGASSGGAAGSSSAGAAGTETDIEGPCSESQPTSIRATGSGSYEVVAETNADPGINEGTIFRPADLSGDERFPIYVWGQGGCSRNSNDSAVHLSEIASHGYFVITDGTPGNTTPNRPMALEDIPAMGAPLLDYVTWAIEQNNKPCSPYYHKLDTSKVAALGFSCGGAMSMGTAQDPRMTTWGYNSSGLGNNQALFNATHTPVLIVEGGNCEIGSAYENGLGDFEGVSATGHPVLFFSKDICHGGDLFTPNGGDFTRIDLAWLNWWLKGDEGATGKGLLVGPGCPFCSDPTWETQAANIE